MIFVDVGLLLLGSLLFFSKLPVMIFIHGGGLTQGSNNYKQYGPMHFMDRGVVMVVPNYRLGPLGFLSMGTPDVAGNSGKL